MRPETLRLLDRLGQTDFIYREYGGEADGDPAAAWPLFALTRRRLSEQGAGRPQTRIVVPARSEITYEAANSLSALMMRLPDEQL